MIRLAHQGIGALLLGAVVAFVMLAARHLGVGRSPALEPASPDGGWAKRKLEVGS
jgi:hypothetical protein